LYGTLEGSQSVLDADNKGIVLKVDTDLNIPEGDITKFTNGEGSTDAINGLIQKTGEWDDKVHGVQEQYYDTGEGIGYASNALDGLIEKHKQLENPDKITVSIPDISQTISDLKELDNSLKDEEVLIQRQEEELNTGKTSLQNEIDRFTAELNELTTEEDGLVSGIDPEIIFKFQRIIKSKHSKGIVAVKGNVCDGCHMILPGQFANEVRNGDKIVFCPYCSRILFYEEVTGEEEQYFQMDAGSLADLDDDFGEEEEEDEDGYDDSDSMKELDF
jgi:FtsZ-binding cell division protein ZapB